MKRWLDVLAACSLALCGVCAAAVLLALAGDLDPRLDILAEAAPLIGAGALLAGALSLLGARTRWAGVALTTVCLAACAILTVPEFLRDAGPAAPPRSPGEIKVIQFNVWRGNRHPERVIDWLVRERPDFVLIEESSPALRDLITARTGWSVAGARTTAMIFSRAPYLVMHRPEPRLKAGLTWVNATYASASGPLEVMVTHQLRPTQWPAPEQNKMLCDIVGSLPTRRLVFGGDFNATPWSFALRRDDRDLGLFRRDRALASWPADAQAHLPVRIPFAVLPIDHIYAGPGWATTGVRRGPPLGSDHYPLVVTLAPTTAGPSPAARCPGSPGR